MTKAKRKSLSGVVVKTMGLFTGVQGVEILCSIVRTKLVALWVGAVGVGLFGLFNNAIELINSLAQLSLRSSSVPSIAKAKPESALRRIAYVVRRWSSLLGIVGATLTLICAPILSNLTFGDSQHTLGFIFLSVVIFLSAITSGELAILQGTKMLSRMARASVWGAIAGLAVSAPLFYFLRIDSIVPALIAYSLTTATAVYCMRNRMPKPEPLPSMRDTFNEGREFVRLGIFMTASAFITLAFSYAFMAWLNRSADTAAVGFYQSGYTIVNRYLGLVFTAIAYEYYPRLSSVARSAWRTSAFVGHEMTIALIVILPVATLFMAFDDVVIRLLYDVNFIVATPYVSWGLAGTAFRAVSWCMAFVILAKGDGKVYLLTETISAAISLALNIYFYSNYGLEGLGIAYIIWYAAYTVIVGAVYFGRYRLRINARVWLLFGCVAVTAIACAYIRSLDMRVPVIIVGLITAALGVLALRRLIRK